MTGPANAAKKLFRNIQEAFQAKSHFHRLRYFQQLARIEYDTDSFLVPTAQSGKQLLKALEPRHEIFVEEWQGKMARHGLDIDQYDFAGDHLLIIEKTYNEVVGTYRLL